MTVIVTNFRESGSLASRGNCNVCTKGTMSESSVNRRGEVLQDQVPILVDYVGHGVSRTCLSFRSLETLRLHTFYCTVVTPKRRGKNIGSLLCKLREEDLRIVWVQNPSTNYLVDKLRLGV